MAHLSWTKFQDFYLRLGFLKALVAVLDARRSSVATELLVRRLQESLFAPASSSYLGWEKVKTDYPWFTKAKKERPGPTIAEVLLLEGRCPSQLYAITRPTSYKILDWGKDVALLGAGNQITEKGLLLKGLLPSTHKRAIGSGFADWNPFVLTEAERLFFLFHLSEIDSLTMRVLDEIAGVDAGTSLETADAARMVCRAFFAVLKESKDHVPPSELPAFRTASDLAATIARELQMTEDIPAATASRRRSVPSPPRPQKIKGTGSLRGRGGLRKTTKNADHQTIPRFEQLVDLGFLEKQSHAVLQSEKDWKARRRWRYVSKPHAHAWARARMDTLEGAGPWEWRSFSGAALQAGIVGATANPNRAPLPKLLDYLASAYESVKRPVGHTPFHSVALVAMLHATQSGDAIEMRDFHNLMLTIKKGGLLQEHVFFASGNELEKMFVLLRPGFDQEALAPSNRNMLEPAS